MAAIALRLGSLASAKLVCRTYKKEGGAPCVSGDHPLSRTPGRLPLGEP